MTNGEKHWDSKVEFICEYSFNALQDKINEFCKGKFVVGIQYPEAFQKGAFVAIVSYKVKQE